MNKDSGGCLSAVAFVIVLWLARPVGLWLFVAIFCAALLHALAKVVGQSESPPANGFWQAALPGLRDAAYCIAAGLSIVTLAQLLLIATEFFSAADVKRWEEAVTQLQHQLSAVMGLSILLWSLAALALLSLLLPNVRPVSRFLRFRKWVKHALLVLTTVASFTFFSSAAVSTNEPRWVAERRAEAKEAVDTIERGRRELVSFVWIQQSLKQLPGGTKKELRSFLTTAATNPDAPNTVLPKAAEVLAQTAPPPPDTGPPNTAGSLQRVGAWLEDKGPTPTLRDVAEVVEAARKTNGARAQAQAAAEEALKAVVGSAVPKGVDPLISPFVKALSSALAKTSLARLSTSDIADYDAAVTFARSKLKWSLRFPSAKGNFEPGGGPSMSGGKFPEMMGSPLINPPGGPSGQIGGPGLQPQVVAPVRRPNVETVPGAVHH